MTPTGKWADLGPRIASGAALVGIGTTCMILGGWWFIGLTALVVGIMIWELATMIAPEARSTALLLGGVSAASVVWASVMPTLYAIAIVDIPAILGAVLLARHRAVFVVYAALIVLAGYGLVSFRETYGITWLVWLVATVVATDIFGYFAGRLIGGPKFWPSISPKKTWAGILAGWIAALIIGYYFWTITDAGRDLLWISVLLSFASQLGDISESAVKRKMGVKDSSNLIPGHGGLFDRFDGLLGGSLFMLITAQFVDIPVLV